MKKPRDDARGQQDELEFPTLLPNLYIPDSNNKVKVFSKGVVGRFPVIRLIRG
jgi:hypothetical protein